jgi:AraC family transcriptional regulator
MTDSAFQPSSKETSPIGQTLVAGCSTGALLLGNSGWCFECGHTHGIGDRCISLNIREDLFGEIAAAVSISRFRFSAPSLPPSKALPIVATMEALGSTGSVLHSEELALRLVERVIAAMVGHHRFPAAPTGREVRRVVEAVRLVASDATRPIELKEMAASAGMSKYHFLRVFRRLTGVTPHQYQRPAAPRRARASLVLPAGHRNCARQRVRRPFHLQQKLSRRVRTDADPIPGLRALGSEPNRLGRFPL